MIAEATLHVAYNSRLGHQGPLENMSHENSPQKKHAMQHTHPILNIAPNVSTWVWLTVAVKTAKTNETPKCKTP
jgi:hypothetical protein